MKYSHFFNFVFQSTLLQEERHVKRKDKNNMKTFQSTLLQEERRGNLPEYYAKQSLSIHAPTRGATKTLCLLFTLKALSIHAPTRGATITLVYPYTLHFTFNPRSYKRSDGQHFQILNCQIIFQSTLLQEERRWISIYPRNDTSFNPRSYKRSDALKM